MRKPFLGAFCAGLFTLFTAASAHSALVVPTGLNPGDAYHVVFVSSTFRDATSTDIDEYDAHVQAAANAAGIGASIGVSWSAVVSTPSVDAINHLSPLFSSTTSVPIYRQDGELLSPSFDGLFDGAIDVAVQVNENGTLQVGRAVWTGSTVSGIGLVGNTLGQVKPGIGSSTGTGNSWIQAGISTSTNQRQFYGMSTELIVPAVPVPAAVWLFGSGVIGLLGIARRKRTK